MWLLIVVLIAVLAAALVALFAVILRSTARRPSADESVASELDPGPAISITEARGSDGRILLRLDDVVLATFTADPGRFEPAAVAGNAAVLAAVTEIARWAPRLAEAVRSRQIMQFTFDTKVMTALADGTARLMSGGKAVAVDSRTARTIAIGTIVAPPVVVGGPVLLALLPAAVAALVSAKQQRVLDGALDRIDNGLDQLRDRLVDADFGVLLAAGNLSSELVLAAASGRIPAQLAAELAVARREVEAAYHARRRGMRRFIAAVQKAHDEHERTHGSVDTWPKGVAEAFGSREQFRDDVLLFVRSAMLRAHLAVATAAVVAHEGDALTAFRLLERTDIELREDVFDVRRRLVALGTYEPTGWRTKEARAAHQLARELTSRIDNEIGDVLSVEVPAMLEVTVDPAADASIFDVSSGEQSDPA
jgi:hypothetical protein